MQRAEREGRRRGAGLIAAVFAVAALAVQTARASAIPDPDFVVLDAAVYAGANRADALFLGGAFTTVDGSAFPHIAAINLPLDQSFSVWAPQLDAAVRAMALSPDGTTLYLGGDFTTIGSEARGRLAALTISNQILTSLGSELSTWNANGTAAANGTIRAMVLSGSTLYVGGDFTTIGGVARNHLASVSTATGSVLPWNPSADGVVRTLVLSADGAALFAGGDFTTVGGQPRRGVAALSLVNGKATAWNAALTGTAVYQLLRSGATLYVGGSFSSIGGQARNNLAALDTALDSALATAWNPDVDGAVRAMALSNDGTRLYAGGVFAAVNGAVARRRIAAFRTDPAGADVLAWDPGADSTIASIDFLLTATDGTALYAGGDFTRIGATDLTGLAAFAIAPPQTTPDQAGGGYQSLASVTLTCTDPSSAGCAAIYYTTDGSDPVTPVSYTGPVTIAITGDTTLKYFSVDADGNREALKTTVYGLDNSAPATSDSLPAGLYGIAAVQDVVLACNDDHVALGCSTYYTLDGTAPSTASTAYTGAISLADLFPPADIDPADVDPLLHMAGTVTLKYFSVDDAGNQESVQTITYQIDLAGPQVTASRPSGNYTGPIAVTLTCNDGTGSGCADMYYTLDDTTPSDGTTRDTAGNVIPRTARYTGPITIASAAVLRALALDHAGNPTSGIIGIYSFTANAGGDRNSAGGVDPLLLLSLAGLWLMRRYAVRGQI